MASSQRRVQVTLTDETYKILKDLSAAVGASMGSLLAELAEEAAPSMQQIVKAVQAAKTKPAKAYEALADALASAQAEASQMQIGLIEKKRKLRRWKGKQDE